MSQENLGVVQNLYEAFANGDIPQVLGMMDAGIEWNEAENFPYADGNPYIGPEAVAGGVFQRLGSEWDYWSLDAAEILDSGDKVVAFGRYRAAHKKTGKEINAQFVHVWTLANGKATRFQQYADTAQVLGAMSGGN